MSSKNSKIEHHPVALKMMEKQVERYIENCKRGSEMLDKLFSMDTVKVGVSSDIKPKPLIYGD